jgi:adenosylmethionine-8-amino-7-oxononanoate aminotransferase
MDPESALRTAFVPHSTPFQVERAKGAYLYTPEGRPILDAAGGAIVGNIGYGREEVAEVAAETLKDIGYILPTWATPQKAALVERLRRFWLPAGITRASFVSGGSESVDAAVRLARQHHVCAGRPERWKVIGTDLSYHGVTLSGLSVGHHAPRRTGLEPLLYDMPKAPAPYSLEESLGLAETTFLQKAADFVEQAILEAGPESVAAFIAEPITGSAGGAIVPPPGYWQRVAEICRSYGVLLIADEVMTGFGRTGKRFGVEHEGVSPDIMVGGKGLSGGYAPAGGVYATEEVVAPLTEARQDLMFYTFAAHPMVCAVSDKVLEIIEREELVARAATTGDRLRERLKRIEEHPNVGQVRGRGLMLGVEFVKDKSTLERFPKEARFGAKVVAAALERGVFFYPAGSGPVHDAIMMGPPFIITDQDIDLMVDALAGAIDDAVSRTALTMA